MSVKRLTLMLLLVFCISGRYNMAITQSIVPDYRNTSLDFETLVEILL